MRIGFVLLDGNVTGGQVVARTLMEGVRSAGGEAIAFLPSDGPMCSQLMHDGFATHLIPLERSYRLDQSAALARAFRRSRLDVVDAHTLYVGRQLTAFAARLARVPLVVHAHIDERYHGDPRVRAVQRLLERLAGPGDTTIAVSAYLRDHLVALGAGAERVVVVHNGVRLRTASAPPEGPHVQLLCVARLTPVKGQEILLEALARAHATVEVDFVGEDLEHGGKQLDLLRRRAVELGVSERTRFLGRRDDLPELLRASHGIVLPSLAEGLPLVVLEAMATARAVIATAAGGTPEAVVDGETGILVPPGDSHALAGAIDAFSGDPRLVRDYGEAGHRRAAALFTVEQMVERTLSVYAAVGRPRAASRRARG